MENGAIKTVPSVAGMLIQMRIGTSLIVMNAKVRNVMEPIRSTTFAACLHGGKNFDTRLDEI